MSPRLFFLSFFFLCVAFTCPLQASERFVRSQLLMGDITVTLTVEDKKSHREAAFAAMEKAFDETRRLENELSEWQPESETTHLNQNAGKPPIPVGQDLMTLLEKARDISEMTDGAFDVTFASKKKGTSYRDVLLNPESGTAALRSGAKIGVSSILKGFIVDRMSGVLKQAGFRKFLVNAGDLYAAGKWKIAIRNPDQPGGSAPLCEIDVQNQAVSTSGQYERGPHIIDPKTGKPAEGFKSVTVIAKKSTDASPLATGIFVMGPGRVESLRKTSGIGILTVPLSPIDTVRCRPF